MANAINSLNFGDNTYTFTLPYGVCGTAADTAAKTVTVDNFSLETGATVIVKFTYANSIASPTLNVNGTGAKPIYRYGTTVASTGTTTSGWIAGAVQMFTYDGTGWIRDYWNNTTYSNASLGQGYATCATAAATTAKVGTLSSYSLTAGGVVSVKFTYDVPASATLNINSKGAKSIYYRGAAITAGVIKAGDIATFIYSSQYHLISIDRWQADIASKAASNHSHSDATTSASGLMTAAMVTKLNGIATGANAYTHPTYTARTGKPTANQTPAFGGTATVSQITSDTSGHVTAATDRTITIPSTLSNGTGTAGLIKTTSTVTSNSGYTACPVISGVPYYKDANTTYSAGTGISLSGTTFSNSGVRSIATGSSNGTISVNTNGTSADVAVKGLGSAAYTASTAYAAASHSHNYAGSSSAGGAATSANKLNTNAGAEYAPVYFSGGVPVVCTSINVTDVIAGSLYGGRLEFKPSASAGNGGYIDFNYNNTADDYTTRLVESSDGLYIRRGTATGEKIVTEGAWNALTLESGVTEVTQAGNRPVGYRKIGNHVYVAGCISFAPSSSAILVTTLPTGYRPRQGVVTYQPATGDHIARVQVYSNGQLKVDFIYKLGGTARVTSGSIGWCSIQLDYFID